MWLDMMHRGMSYRNDGQELANGKRDAFQRMLMRYPADAANAACKTLRPDNWFPGVDTVQREIEDMLAWRNEAYEALENGEVFTAEQLHSMKSRALSYDLAEVLACFPIYDTGKPSRLTYFEKQTQKLKLALDAYLDHDAETTDFVDKRNISIAQKYLADGFNEDPNITETAKQREDRMKDEREEMTRQKAAMIEELKT